MSSRYLGKGKRHNRKVGPGRDSEEQGPKVRKLNEVRPVAKKRLRQGAVVWARVPFADGTGEKKRPAVVEERVGRTVTLRPITTSNNRHRLNAHEVIDLTAAGLIRPSGVGLQSRQVDLIDVLSVVGELGHDDEAGVFGIDSRYGDAA